MDCYQLNNETNSSISIQPNIGSLVALLLSVVLVSKCICLLFSGKQIMQSGFLELHLWKHVAMTAVKVNQYNELKLAINLRKAEGSCTFS